VSAVGIPRALLYYHYAPVWRAFFDALGIEVVVSPPTMGETLTLGAARVVSETCMPVKVYCGQVLSLLGRVDCVLVPSVDPLRPGTRNCPKLIGLPDLIADVIPEAPLLTIDVRGQGQWPPLAQLALLLSKHWIVHPLALKGAIGQAQAAAETVSAPGNGLPDGASIHDRISEAGTSTSDAPAPGTPAPGALTVGVVGHPYNLYDDYTTHRLLDRLRALGVRVLTPEAVPPVERWAAVQELAETPYWTYEDEYVGAAGGFLRRAAACCAAARCAVDGLLSVSAFGCAPDSVMSSVLARAARQAEVPYMALVLDEHSGQAGLVTRLEAFVDMLARRRERRSERRKEGS
jgi:predicted nucleotide-binding protein (sugar kinase/HSP70/actin superfamily)